MRNLLITNGNVLTPASFARTGLHIADGIIADRPPSGPAQSDTDHFDAGGGLVLPGIVDLHGDAFERSIEPRPGVTFAIADALHDVDGQLIANGITTAFHAVSVSWEAGIRSIDAARDIFRAIEAETFRASVHAHIRWETFAVDEAREVLDWLAAAGRAILSINDHTTANLHLRPPSTKLDRMASRMGIPVGDVVAALEAAAGRADRVEPTIEAVCARAEALSVPVFSHDDRTVEERQRLRDQGVRNCEFPMAIEAAREARRAGEPVILGAPNVVRGGSQNNAVDARAAIDADLCSALVSDYSYPTIMKAAFQLAGADHKNLAEAWHLVSTAPARIAGLGDRGELTAGRRGDILVFWPDTTALRAVFVNGRKVLEYG